jgi:hypothetical protein
MARRQPPPPANHNQDPERGPGPILDQRNNPIAAGFQNTSGYPGVSGAFVDSMFHRDLSGMLRERARCLFDDFVRAFGPDQAA